MWLREHGIKARDKQLRSDAHYIEYFVLELALALFGEASCVSLWIVLVGCGLGLLDECVKILLPIREFELVDLLKNCIGILVAVAIVTICSRLMKRNDSDGKTEN